jgi:hypothetical protein
MLGTGGSAAPSADLEEERAKRAWLASLEEPTWGPAQSHREEVMAYQNAVALSEHHNNPRARLEASGFGRVPIATYKPAARNVGDDHTDPGARLAMLSIGGAIVQSADLEEERAKRAWLATLEEPTWGTEQSPWEKVMSNQNAAKYADDHTNPAAHLEANDFGRVQIATYTPAATMVGDDHTDPGARLAMLSIGGSAVQSADLKEERAKRAWLASLDEPTWGTAQSFRGQVMPTQTAFTDDHTNPGARLDAGDFGRVPIATYTRPAEHIRDDHTNTNLVQLDEFGRVPIATFTPAVALVDDDHTDPGARLATSGFGRVPMATGTPAERPNAGSAEDRAKRAWLAKLDEPSWGAR